MTMMIRRLTWLSAACSPSGRRIRRRSIGLFRHSGLIRDKWDEKRGAQTYGERTITEALARQTEHYRPRRTATRQTPKTGNNSQTDSRTAAVSRPDILLNTEMTRIVDETQAALLALPEAPIIYQRARHLAVIARGVKPPKWLHRPHDMPVILDASTARLTELASQAAEYWKYGTSAEGRLAARPSAQVGYRDAAKPSEPGRSLSLKASLPARRSAPMGACSMRQDTMQTTGLYLDTNGTTFPPLPARPTLDDARSAIGHLQEAVTDFPFTEHLALQRHPGRYALAGLSLCRAGQCAAVSPSVPTPAGAAKVCWLMSSVLSAQAAPRPRWPQVKEDEEERKRLLTVALAGYPCLHIDNVTRPLGSPALDMALTSPTFSDRLLGKQRESRKRPCIWYGSPAATICSFTATPPAALCRSTWTPRWSGPRNAPTSRIPRSSPGYTRNGPASPWRPSPLSKPTSRLAAPRKASRQ